jgi:hypothetical protein
VSVYFRATLNITREIFVNLSFHFTHLATLGTRNMHHNESCQTNSLTHCTVRSKNGWFRLVRTIQGVIHTSPLAMHIDAPGFHTAGCVGLFKRTCVHWRLLGSRYHRQTKKAVQVLVLHVQLYEQVQLAILVWRDSRRRAYQHTKRVSTVVMHLPGL